MNHAYFSVVLLFASSIALHKESQTRVFVQMIRVTKLDSTLKNVLRTTYPVIFIEKVKTHNTIKLP